VGEGNVVGKRAKAAFDPKTFLAKVGEGKTISKYRNDQVIFSQGQVADAVFYIQQGKVKLTVISEHGKEAVVGILGPGQFFGEGCLNGHPVRIATTRAVDECLITRIDKATMIAAMHNEPKFSELFMSYLLTRNSRIEEDLIDQLFNSSEKRLARLLLLLANFGKEGRPEPIVGKFSQETLAEMIGTTRSRVSFFMNKFRKLGFIEYNGKLEVHNSLLNVVLQDKPEIKTRDASIDAE
jgi:CRP/FNR family transcriptional regulator, cyclic AMP receptor protein